MPRRRMIDPEIWRNEKVGSLPDAGRLLFIGIFSQADDDGRLKASPRFLMASIFPYDKDKTEDEIRKLRDQCVELGLIRIYSNSPGSKKEYLDIPSWREHQQIRKDRYNPSILPSFDESNKTMVTSRQPEGNQTTTTGSHSIVKSSIVKSNTPLTNVKGARKKQTDPRVAEIFKEMEAFLGYPEKVDKNPIPNYPKEGQFIKKILGRHFTREDILSCWKEKVQRRRGEFVSMAWVNDDIANFVSVGEHLPTVKPDRNNAVKPEKERSHYGTGYKPPKPEGASKPGKTIDAEGGVWATD